MYSLHYNVEVKLTTLFPLHRERCVIYCALSWIKYKLLFFPIKPCNPPIFSSGPHIYLKVGRQTVRALRLHVWQFNLHTGVASSHDSPPKEGGPGFWRKKKKKNKQKTCQSPRSRPGGWVTSTFKDMHTRLLAPHIRVPNALTQKHTIRASLISVAGAAFITRAGVHGRRTLEGKRAGKIINSPANLWREPRLYYTWGRLGVGGCVGYTPSCHFSLKRVHTWRRCVNVNSQTSIILGSSPASACFLFLFFSAEWAG